MIFKEFMIKNADFWNERYASADYVFGREPNEYFKTRIDKLNIGKILIPAAGEGRDAIYAACKGWDVFAFDQSRVAQKKALELAKNNGVKIHYSVCDMEDFIMRENEYDSIAVIYFHLMPEQRSRFFKKVRNSLKNNGTLILEAFNVMQLNNSSGGPKEIEMLLSKDILSGEFSSLQIIENTEEEIILSEGGGHSGKADVVRFMARKFY